MRERWIETGRGRLHALAAGPATVTILPGCGHVPHREREGEVLDLVRVFLLRLERSA